MELCEEGKDTARRKGKGVERRVVRKREGERRNTLSFELEAKVLLEPSRNSRRASAKGTKENGQLANGKEQRVMVT